jgi:hypothetical protein
VHTSGAVCALIQDEFGLSQRGATAALLAPEELPGFRWILARHPVQETDQRAVELVWSLQRCEVADTGRKLSWSGALQP